MWWQGPKSLSHPSLATFQAVQWWEAGIRVELGFEPMHSNMGCGCFSGIPTAVPNAYPVTVFDL